MVIGMSGDDAWEWEAMMMTRGGDSDNRQYRAGRMDTLRNVKLIGQASKEVVLGYSNRLKL